MSCAYSDRELEIWDSVCNPIGSACYGCPVYDCEHNPNSGDWDLDPEDCYDACKYHKPTERKTMSIRAKMTLEGVISTSWGGWKALFRCVYDDKKEEDRSFQKATPTGQAEFVIDNPAAMNQLVIGKSYYFDISEAN